MPKDVTRGISLDRETDRQLMLLARRFEGNRSLTVRELIRQAAARAAQDAQRARPKESA